MKWMLLVITMLLQQPLFTIARESRDDDALSDGKSGKSEIRALDFRNFDFSSYPLFEKNKSVVLKNGRSTLANGFEILLTGVFYTDIADEDDDEALVILEIGDGNATHHVLLVFTLSNKKPKLLANFRFGDDNRNFATAFGAHGELIIETYNQLAGDAECCPSVIEISNYKWTNGKFSLQGKPQTTLNSYVERLKKKAATN